ncbi:MAG TPA: BatA and WFA domain-containing protein, partial [Candidatus Sulfotelmatobacter sp.]|nr:BatA and WFA domain-containing protein [Candidatus Sulfotelmatobacter sp.]
MTFLNPSALLFLLGIPVVVLFHLLKMRRREVVVSSTWLWGDSLRNQEANAPFRRLKPNLLLLLQTLVILILALALAHPVRTVLRSGYERNVLILDVSAGMQATDVPGSRFEVARRAALEAIGRLGAGQQAMLIESGEEARVAAAFTGDQRTLTRAVQALQPADVPGRLAEAFRLAQANLGTGSGPAVVDVFTDGAFDPPSLPDLGGAAVRWHRVGQRGRNVGITAFEARKTYFGTLEHQAFVSVANFGPEVETFDLTLSLDGRRLKTERVTLGPDLRRSFVIPFAPREGGLLKAEIDVADDLTADNQALAVIPAPKPLRVLLVSPAGNIFLEKALAADPLVQVQRGTAENLSAAGTYDVAIIDSVPLKAPLPSGRYVLVNTVPPGVPLEVQGRVQQPTIMDWDRSHPAMRYLDLSKVVIQEALRLRPLGSSRTLVESSLTPLITAVDERGLRAILIGFDLTRSDFPLRVAFPLFLGNALRWLNPSRLEDAGLQLKTGQPITVSLPAAARQATVTDPSGVSRTLAADADGRVTFMDTGRAGLYEIRAGSWQQRFALNLVNEGESNLRPRFEPADRAGAAGGERRAQFPSRTPLWP